VSVRRLDPVQPGSFAFSADNLAWAKKTIGNYPTGKQASAVIPLLWRAQEQHDGWVSKPAIEYVASMLGMPFIRVLEVATFYTMFQLSPVGRRAHIQVCGTTPCMLRGAEGLKRVCQHKIHRDPRHLSADGDFSWEEVECLGACVNAPMVQIFKDTYEDLTPESFEKLIDDIAAGKTVKPGPQNGRQLSAPEGGPTTLTEKSLFFSDRKFTRVEPAPPAPQAVPAVTEEPKPIAVPKPAAEMKTVEITNPQAPKPIRLSEQKVQPARKPVANAKDEGAPELLNKPRSGGKADDLKLIWGVGPALEKMLNRMGVWHFDQIAAWTAKDLAWVDERLEGFKGRAKRDEWVKQSKKLAIGEKPKAR
jgi:NADH-quinone oxidoreductase subunit E